MKRVNNFIVLICLLIRTRNMQGYIIDVFQSIEYVKAKDIRIYCI